MNNTLLDRLTQLDLEERTLKRSLDASYCNEKERTRLFNKIKLIKKEKDKIKFKIHLERKIKNENNNTY